MCSVGVHAVAHKEALILDLLPRTVSCLRAGRETRSHLHGYASSSPERHVESVLVNRNMQMVHDRCLCESEVVANRNGLLC